ncbi:endonuclease/exonuclease/phosphatase family protein [Asaia sp. VD9]|uniref:endonuclease/exonuclease/phosphatase family protein n=1 Tax=Asaia sp. VD9 TaxID=3081235 RepID=UPI003017AC68
MASRPDWLLGLLLAVWVFAPSAEASPLKIATWNLDWLILPASARADLPPNIPSRSGRDWAALTAEAARLDADIIAVQEVANEAALAQLFPPLLYHLVLSHAPIAQNLGLALRAPWHVVVQHELRALDRSPQHGGHALRPGLDVVVSDGSYRLRLLVIHLKSGCWERSWTESRHACPVLREQIAILSDWIAEREDEGEAYAIIGDFNRRLTLQDPYYRALVDAAQPLLVTSGLASPCEGGSYFIDHILLGGQARNWLISGSLRVMLPPKSTPAFVLSDHCPVSVRLSPR